MNPSLPVGAAVRVEGADLDEGDDPGVLSRLLPRRLVDVGQVEGTLAEGVADGPLVHVVPVACDETGVTTVQVFLGVVVQLQKFIQI